MKAEELREVHYVLNEIKKFIKMGLAEKSDFKEYEKLGIDENDISRYKGEERYLTKEEHKKAILTLCKEFNKIWKDLEPIWREYNTKYQLSIISKSPKKSK